MGSPSGQGLVKIGELSKRSGVSGATIKYYIREGLLPEPALRTSRNMAWYDPALVPRIKAIKELQRTRFLPLKVIRRILDGAEPLPPGSDSALTESVARILGKKDTSKAVRTRQQLLDEGVAPDDLDWLRRIGLVSPDKGAQQEQYSGEDLELVKILSKARASGLTPQMLPPSILAPYVEAIRHLTRLEIQLFRMGVVPRAGDDVEALVSSANELSEQLIIQLRRKLLLPTLEAVMSGKDAPNDASH